MEWFKSNRTTIGIESLGSRCEKIYFQYIVAVDEKVVDTGRDLSTSIYTYQDLDQMAKVLIGFLLFSEDSPILNEDDVDYDFPEEEEPYEDPYLLQDIEPLEWYYIGCVVPDFPDQDYIEDRDSWHWGDTPERAVEGWMEEHRCWIREDEKKFVQFLKVSDRIGRRGRN